MLKTKKLLVVLIIIISLLFFRVLFAYATDENTQQIVAGEETTEQTEEQPAEDDYETQINNLEGQIEDYENAISSTETQIGVVEGVLSETLEEIESLSTKIEKKKKEIWTLEQQEVSLNSFIEKEEVKLEEYTQRYEDEKLLLEKRLVVMYEMGDTHFFDIMFSSADLTDLLSKYYYLAKIGEADRTLVNNVKRDKEQTESITQSLQESRDELEVTKEENERYKISLDNLEILKNNKINSLNDEEIALYEEIENYRKEIENIENEIKRINLENLGKVYIGGNFIWPTPGYSVITSPFGMRTHPITGIYKLHTGTDIGAPYGADFVAANDGIVVNSSYNSAYGNMVIIDHGGGVVTLYAHGSERLVETGDVVTQGQPVLKVGATGYATGPHAHFEIRVNGEYLNPMDYITPDNSGVNKRNIEEVTVETN